MSGSDLASASGQEENEVRQLLAMAGTGDRPTATERDRIADAMWTSFERSTIAASEPAPLRTTTSGRTENSHRHQTMATRQPARLLLWAAILLVVIGAVGAMLRVDGQSIGPAGSPGGGRTTTRLGDTDLSFDTPTGYEIDRLGPALMTFTADRTNIGSHRHITVAQASELFGGHEPDDFFANAGLQPESVTGAAGSTVWLVPVDDGPSCIISQPCLAIAVLPDGERLKLVAGTYTRIEIYDNGDSGPIVVVSQVGTPTAGPALIDVELSP